jgi:2-C-methyl-D-erythritol 4-phosphate cytidylyltransferase
MKRWRPALTGLLPNGWTWGIFKTDCHIECGNPFFASLKEAKAMKLLRRFFKKKKEEKRPWCAAVVPAAGNAVRMEGQDKILSLLGNWPVLAHTIRALESSSLIDEIVVVTRGDLIVTVGQLCRDYGFSKVKKVIVGGDSRTRSVLAGIMEVSKETEFIAIHDGARPLVTHQVIDAAILQAVDSGAAAPAVAVKDTVKRAAGGIVEATLDRSGLFAVQTPQVFDADLILAALKKAEDDEAVLTDDCAAVERMGMTVTLTQGSYENLKITTPIDFILAQAILQERDIL